MKIVLLNMHHSSAYARRGLEAGAHGFVPKHSAADELVLAINATLQGYTFVTPALTTSVLRSARKGTKAKHALTRRQREILQLLAEGNSASKIAMVLAISRRTVEFHKYQIMKMHGVHNSAELIHLAIKNGMVKI